MAYGGYSYLDYGYEPAEDDFVLLVWAKGAEKISRIAEAIAAESSVGSWTRLKTMNSFVWERYRARVYEINKIGEKAGFIKIAYPIGHFDRKNVPQLFASVFGNIFGLKELDELYIFDISIPLKYQRQFDGPYAGMEGIRKLLGTEKSRRPHVGTIVKPKVGLAPAEWADVAYRSYLGGLDLVKDDENLVDQDFCRWKDRLHKVVDAIERAGKETNQKHVYSSNISDKFGRMIERLDYLNDMGLQKNVIVMLDVYIMGISALLEVLEHTKRYRFATHGHRAGFAASNRGNFGINYQVYEKFYRLFGVDQLHIGTGVGKMEGSLLAIKQLHDVAEKRMLEEKPHLGSLAMEFAPHIKPMLSIASGGVDAGKVDALVALHGNNTNIQAGAGVHGHPGGTIAGAKSMRQAVDAVVAGIPAPEYARTHRELAQALEQWDYFDPKKVKKELASEIFIGRKIMRRVKLKGRAAMNL